MGDQTFRDHVYRNWKKEQGPCDGCDIHDGNFHPANRPQFGGFDTDADVMIVNHTPRGIGGEYGHNTRRRYLDTPEGAFEEHTVGNPPENVDEVLSVPEATSTEAHDDVYGEQFVNGSWPTLNQFIELFSEGGGPIDLSIRDTYYTNAVKCPLLVEGTNGDVDDAGGRNNQAKRKCGEYLQKEIEDLIQPRVIITGGREAYKRVRDVLSQDIPPGTLSLTSLITDGPANGDDYERFDYAAYGRQPAVIPCQQFGRRFSSWAKSYAQEMRGFSDDSTSDPQSYFAKQLAERMQFELSI